MPYLVSWLVPYRVIDAHLEENLTIAEFHQYDQDIIAMMNASYCAKVHIIVNLTHLQQFPSLRQSQNLKLASHPKMGWAFMYGSTNPLLKTIAVLVARLFNCNIAWCATRADAVTALKQVDQTLSLP